MPKNQYIVQVFILMYQIKFPDSLYAFHPQQLHNLRARVHEI